MGAGMSYDSDDSSPPPSSFNWGVVALVLIALLATGYVLYKGFGPEPPDADASGSIWCMFHSHRDVCHVDTGHHEHSDVTSSPISTPDTQPSRETIFALRHAAWQNDDFAAQVALGKLYYASRDNSSWNPVEAYVWYFLASINAQARYDGDVEDRDSSSDHQYPYIDVYHEVKRAQRARAQIAELFTSDQRDEARNRIVYVLACRGPSGLALLGELYSPWSPVEGHSDDSDSSRSSSDSSYRGDPDSRGDGSYRDDEEPVRPISKNDHDAMLYYVLASNAGAKIGLDYDGYALAFAQYLRDNRNDGGEIIATARADAQRWHLPYEYYPESRARSGIPLTDECNANPDGNDEPDEDEPISAWTLQRALFAMGDIGTPPEAHQFDIDSGEMHNAMKRYQAENGFQPTGRLTIAQELDLVSRAANDKRDPATELALGKIYVLGTIQSVPSVANGDGEQLWERVAANPSAGPLL